MVGGMPGIVAAYVKNGPPEEIKSMQADILQTYQVDLPAGLLADEIK